MTLVGCPFHFEFPVAVHTIQKVKVNQALVWNIRFVRHLLEVLNDLRLKAKSYLLLELLSIRILAGLHL